MLYLPIKLYVNNLKQEFKITMIRKRISKMTGGTTYQVIARVKGYPDQVKTFRTKREAESWETRTKAAMQAGTYRDDKPVRDKTLTDAIDRFLKDPLFQKKKNCKTIRGHLRWWREALGKYALGLITPDLIAKKRDELASGITVRGRVRTPASVNRYIASLSSVFKVAVEEWRWLIDSPVKSVRKLKEPRGRTRYLSDEERARLLQSCKESKNPHIYPIVVLALSTGMRRGEILNLRWSDVDLESGKVVLTETKNGETRVVYITKHALDAIGAHAQEHMFKSQYLFPNAFGDKPVAIEQAWQNVVKRAALSDFKFHDLRHSAASYLAMNGATPSEIAEVLGHKTLAMVKRYAHLSEDHTKSVIESMNEKIFM